MYKLTFIPIAILATINKNDHYINIHKLMQK